MIIVQPISTPQTITVYARNHTSGSYSVEITDEETSKTTTTAVSGVFNGTSIEIPITHPFLSERWYMIKIFSTQTGEGVVNFSKIYCTAQSEADKYTVLDGYYQQIDKPKTNYIVKK